MINQSQMTETHISHIIDQMINLRRLFKDSVTYESVPNLLKNKGKDEDPFASNEFEDGFEQGLGEEFEEELNEATPMEDDIVDKPTTTLTKWINELEKSSSNEGNRLLKNLDEFSKGLIQLLNSLDAKKPKPKACEINDYFSLLDQIDSLKVDYATARKEFEQYLAAKKQIPISELCKEIQYINFKLKLGSLQIKIDSAEKKFMNLHHVETKEHRDCTLTQFINALNKLIQENVNPKESERFFYTNRDLMKTFLAQHTSVAQFIIDHLKVLSHINEHYLNFLSCEKKKAHQQAGSNTSPKVNPKAKTIIFSINGCKSAGATSNDLQSLGNSSKKRSAAETDTSASKPYQSPTKKVKLVLDKSKGLSLDLNVSYIVMQAQQLNTPDEYDPEEIMDLRSKLGIAEGTRVIKVLTDGKICLQNGNDTPYWDHVDSMYNSSGPVFAPGYFSPKR